MSVLNDEFYETDGTLSETGRFLKWLAEQGPTMTRGLSQFPGWGSGRKSERQDVLSWLEHNGFIVIERRYNGKTGHPPTIHEVTAKGADWAEILSNFTVTPDSDVDVDALLERVEALEAMFDSLSARLAALGDTNSEWARLRAV